MSLFTGDKVKVLSKSCGSTLELCVNYISSEIYEINKVICNGTGVATGETVYKIQFEQNRNNYNFLEKDLKLVERNIEIGTKVKLPYMKKGIPFFNNNDVPRSNTRDAAIDIEHNYMIYNGMGCGEYRLAEESRNSGDFYNLDEIEPYDEPFRVGDICILAPWLAVGIAYGRITSSITFLSAMERWKTESFKITQVNDNYETDANGFIFSHEMLIKVGQTAQTRNFASVEPQTPEPEPQIEERRETQMKWRSVEGNLLIGNRIKCTWESQNENGLGIDVCMHTHSANRRESNSQIITKMVKIPGTWQENVPKEIQIFKDIDGWITIKTTRTHFASRGNVERTFYQAICPEHVPAYEAEQSLINAQAVNQAERAAQERAEQQAERDRVAARQAELNRERAEATARREQAQREAQERERINNEKFNIWVHHEKNEIL